MFVTITAIDHFSVGQAYRATATLTATISAKNFCEHLHDLDQDHYREETEGADGGRRQVCRTGHVTV